MAQKAAGSPNQQQDARKVSFLLAVGIVILPGIFVWFLLRDGHSTLSRVLGIGWTFVLLVFAQAVVAGINSLPDAPKDLATEVVEAETSSSPPQEPDDGTVSEELETSGPQIAQSAPPSNPALADEERRGMHCLNNWDGSHWKMQAEIKKRLRDPDSFEHVETRITPIDEVGNHSIFMTFRARNGIGGMNVQQAIGVVDNKECELQILQML